MSREWSEPSPVDVARGERPFDPEAYALESALRSLVMLGAVTARRAIQTTLGSSEAGHLCDRRIAYKLAGVPSANLRDPLRSFVGVGVHYALAEMFSRLDATSGRFLVERELNYRGIPGTVDLFDRFAKTIIDWKTTTLAKIKRLRHEGPTASYVVQTQLYGAALVAAGEDVRHVALAFLPIDGTLDDLWVWRAPFDQSIADRAVDRIVRLAGQDPASVPASPDRMCPWCHHYRKGSTDLARACPGVES